MPIFRSNRSDDLVLKDGNLGINTSSPDYKLDIADGNTKLINSNVTGVATFSSYAGYLKSNQNIVDNRVIKDSSSTLSGEIIVGAGKTITVSESSEVGQGNILSLKVSNTFTPPIGSSDERPSAPQPGALFYNKDFRTIEYWDGNFWRQVDNVTTSGRGIFGGGQPAIGSGYIDPIQYIQIHSKGNSQYFGELTSTGHGAANVSCCSSAIRGLFMGGSSPNTSYMNVIEYVTIASAGDAVNFGDLTTRVSYTASCSSSTRGVNMGGHVGQPSSYTSNVISYVEISTLGDAKDFGDLQQASYSPAGASNGTRGMFAGGYIAPVNLKGIESITISSKGNANTFGDLSAIRWGPSGSSNRTRMVVAGGRSPENGANSLNTIEFITMASEGNGVDFGNMSIDKVRGCSVSSQTRCVFATGAQHPSGATNTIEFIEIATGGTTEDFGDTTNAAQYAMGSCSDSHGGLGGF